ncbi:hypothetical protein [Bacteroides pyogenes]|uniref:hypothetical protein n=1 Tax=Bacteroides pyogenes TaxID=310300 RepID=UPI0016532530|nr:hypothetical protein [Bacteroides pyogenes]MDY4250033.1 hypothetical protein [Bacteroides pyogenes]
MRKLTRKSLDELVKTLPKIEKPSKTNIIKNEHGDEISYFSSNLFYILYPEKGPF